MKILKNKKLKLKLVSFELATALHKQGFDCPCSRYFNKNGLLGTERTVSCIPAPSLELALTWINSSSDTFIDIIGTYKGLTQSDFKIVIDNQRLGTLLYKSRSAAIESILLSYLTKI